MAKYRANASEPFKTLKIKALDSMPVGTIMQYAGETIPTGWLECNGATITQSDYPELYNLIGGTLPDYRGRVLVGQDTNDTDFDTLGETGGSKTDNLSKAYAKVGRSSASYASLQYTATSGSGTFNRKQSQGLGFDGSTETITDATALGGSVSTLQPYAVVKHIIKAKNTTPTMASIVNAYSTSTQDGYSCKYINDSEKYSTTETKTNKTWIDGKPIYRIMFTGTISSGDYRTIGSITNLDKIINFGGTIVDSTNDIKYVIGKSGYVDGSGISRIIAIGNNIRLDAKSSSYSNMPFEAYIEYTKTTD